jgi:hypothetical protein
MLDSGMPLSEAAPPPSTIAYARELAHLGIPLGSPRRGGHCLGIHENTVASRVRAAEERLGAPWDRRCLQLLLALELLDVVKPHPARG